jgi:hypothetical protein
MKREKIKGRDRVNPYNLNNNERFLTKMRVMYLWYLKEKTEHA